MGSLTVRNIEDDIKTGLRLRAAKKGVSMESEVREILRDAIRPQRKPALTPKEREAKIQRILALGRPPSDRRRHLCTDRHHCCGARRRAFRTLARRGARFVDLHGNGARTVDRGPPQGG